MPCEGACVLIPNVTVSGRSSAGHSGDKFTKYTGMMDFPIDQWNKLTAYCNSVFRLKTKNGIREQAITQDNENAV